MFHASNADDFKFGAFSLRRAIAPTGGMQPSDVMRTKSALGRLGHFDIEREKLNGYPSRPLIDGVKNFQREQGLTVDGLMTPDGPTARRLTSLIGDMNQTDGSAGDDSSDGVAATPPAAKAPWFKSSTFKPLSDEDTSANGRMLGGLLKYNVNGDLPNLFADALKDGGAKPVHEFADFLRQLGDARPDRVAGFESDVMGKLTGGERTRIKRLAEGPARPRTLEHRHEEGEGPPTPAPAVHRDGMVFDKGQWRAQTRAEKAREGLQLLAAEGGNGGESSSGGEGAGADGASGEGGGEERNPRTIPGATDQPKQSDSANPAGKNRPLLTPTTTKPVNIADAHKEFNFNAEGAKEEITAILNPYDAYRANELSYSVPEKVRKLQDDRKLPPEGRNNETDAVRHTLWNYEMTKTFGAKEAKKIGDAHERGAIRNIFKKDGSGPNDESERLMDLHNNKVGRELALDPKNKARSSTDVVLDALKKGKLRTKPFKVQTPPPGLLPRNWLAN